jgi:hypothetical protein
VGVNVLGEGVGPNDGLSVLGVKDGFKVVGLELGWIGANEGIIVVGLEVGKNGCNVGFGKLVGWKEGGNSPGGVGNEVCDETC